MERKFYRDELKRNFDAVKGTRLPQNFRLTTGTAEEVNSGSRDKIRALARNLENNSDIGESITSAFYRNVIGSGITLQSKNENENINTKIESSFRIWSMVGNCEVTGKLSFTDVQEIILRRILYDGGILIKKVITKDTIPFKLQLVEVDALNSTATPKNVNNRVESGVEVDSVGRDLGYHLCKTDKFGYTSNETEYISSSDMIFLRRIKRPSQIREMSQISCTASRISDTNEYLDAVSVKERIAASYSLFITSNTPTQSVGRTGISNRNTDTGMPIEKITPGMVKYLNKGEDVKPMMPNGQASDTEVFTRTQLRLLSAGQGLSYETVSRDLSNVNYSSARQNLLEDRETFDGWQRFIIEHFCEFVYQEFISALILRGILCGNVSDFNEHKWISSGYNWIDPLKEAKANEAALASNQTTLEILCAEKGLDYKEVLIQRAKEKELMRELDIIDESTSDIEKTSDSSVPTEENVVSEGTIAQVSLNGAQISALLLIVQSVVDSKLEYGAALTLITSAFPYDEETAKKILGNPNNLVQSEEVVTDANEQTGQNTTDE